MIRTRPPRSRRTARENRPPDPPKIVVVAALGKHAALFDLKEVREIQLYDIADSHIADVRQLPHVYLYSVEGYEGTQRELCRPSNRIHVYPSVDVDASAAFQVDLETNEQRTQGILRVIKMAWQHYCDLAYRPGVNYLVPTDTVTIMALTLTEKFQQWLIENNSDLIPSVTIREDHIVIAVGECVLWDSRHCLLGELRLNRMKQEFGFYGMEVAKAFAHDMETALCPICEGFMAKTADHVHAEEDPDLSLIHI